MATGIKITSLSPIGANITYTTLVPVVNMAGPPTTEKATTQVIGNLILNGAGGSYFPPAAQAVLAQSVTNAAQPNITSVGTLTSLAVTGNVNLGSVGNITIAGGSSGQILSTNGNGALSWVNDSSGTYSNNDVANYLPTYTGIVGANKISSGSNVEIDADGAVFVFGQGGALYWPAGINQWAIEPNSDNEFEIKSTSNVVISTDISNANSHFTFDTDGIFTAPSNVNLLGSRLNVGPDAASAGNLLNPTLVIANTGAQYIQAAIINNDGAGSSDWSADGAGGGDAEAWTDMGFAGFSFNDANFTVSAPGDGYLFVQGYANGLGGNMVLATGDHSNTADIIFATGGFLANNEFARIDHANDVFHLTRPGSGIKFYDGTVQTTAGGGGGAELVNGNNSFVLDNDGNVVFEGTPSGNAVNRGLVWDFGANANGVNSQLRQDNSGFTVRAWTENSGNYSAPVNIVTNQDANTKTWIFDGNGNLTLPGNLIVPTGNIESDTLSPAFSSAITGITTGNATVIVTLADPVFIDPFQGEVTISSVTGTTEANGVWGYQATDPNEFQLYTDATLTTPVDGTTWTAYVSGGNAVGGSTYTDFTIQGGNVSISSNDNTWVFDIDGIISAGGNLKLAPDSTNAASYLDVFLSSGPDLHLVASNGANLILGEDDGPNVMASWDGNVYVQSWSTNTNTQGGVWTFGEDGLLTLPSGNVVIGNLFGGEVILASNTPFGVVSQGNGSTVLQWMDDVSNASALSAIYINSPSGNTGDVAVLTGEPGANANIWTFGNDGNITLPGNTVAINFANGSSAFGNIVATNLDGNVSNVLTGNGTFVALPVINANTVIWSTAPVANTSNGTAGQAAYDSGGNLYVCVTTDTWAKFTGTTSW